jgi:hypothetical protein
VTPTFVLFEMQGQQVASWSDEETARAATIFNGEPLGDNPPLICARHLTAELAAS